KINMIKPDKKILTSNKSGVTGVCYDKNRKKWVSQITFQGKNINLGRFIRFEDAVKARKNAEEIYFKPILKKYENRGGRKNEK
ncbi:AP2 domain-containing protein, partial [Listeria monocytogenes]|nr:AP2 domain-containing protein [Listeria monocytogenes]EAD9495087.1 AP2 domain-containing protein [Listeria monocytogenes]